MTLIVAALGQESIWISADRRLSIGEKTISDEAVKVLRLERGNDRALLGYSGLGQTPKGMQPSGWMNNVLRGINEQLERSLEILGGAISRQIPKYMFKVPGAGLGAHVVLAPAFVAERPLLYTLRLDIDVESRRERISIERHETDAKRRRRRHARIGIAGSGEPFIVTDRSRLVALLRMVKAHEKGKVAANTVATEFAKINFDVSKKCSTVGPNCVVAWHYRRNGPLKLSPSARAFNGLAISRNGPSVPVNCNGVDMTAFLGALRPFHLQRFKDMRDGKVQDEVQYKAAVEEALNKLPTRPDEKL